MDNTNHTTEHRKGQHLCSEERHEIEVRRKDGWSIYKIAQHLGRPYNTIKNEITRGSTQLKSGGRGVYRADRGEKVYRENRQNSCRRYRCLATIEFLEYVVERFRSDEHWSLDACVGNALRSGKFSRNKKVCTKTLYNYVDLGLLPIKNIDLPEKLCRNTKGAKVRENKRNLGRSIDDRDEIVQFRTEFGHWEVDTVVGKKNASEPCVLTLVERMTRMCIWVKARNHTAGAIQEALAAVMKHFGSRYRQVFKTITSDNGSEFADLSLLDDGELKVYFTHPYSSCEKGTNERHNRMLRRFIPKGKSIAEYSADDICFFADCINRLPRRILGYASPEELFEAQLDRIYAA